jgi:hypothetical protein
MCWKMCWKALGMMPRSSSEPSIVCVLPEG